MKALGYYPTPSHMAKVCLARLAQYGDNHKTLIDLFCGNYELSLPDGGNSFFPTVIGYDIVERDYGVRIWDYQSSVIPDFDVMIANPPFVYSFDLAQKVCGTLAGRTFGLFANATFLEGIARREFLIRYQPVEVVMFADRIKDKVTGNTDRTGRCFIIWSKDLWPTKLYLPPYHG